MTGGCSRRGGGGGRLREVLPCDFRDGSVRCVCGPALFCLTNLSTADCGSNGLDLKKELEKESVDWLTEELKLQETVAAEHAQHANGTFMEARIAKECQREAGKCSAAPETCEDTRERAGALFTKEKRQTFLWERHARKLGWGGE